MRGLANGFGAMASRSLFKARPEADDITSAQKAVLAIGAHPDDIEFGCGAALLRFQRLGYATHGMVITDGANGGPPLAPLKPNRVQEAVESGRTLGLQTLTALQLPDCGLFARRSEVRAAIETAIALWEPAVVLTHTPADLHLDHQLVFHATLEAARTVPTLLCYENPNTPSDFSPNLFVDVTPYLRWKMSALACHASQRRKSYIQPEVVRSIARMRGNQAHVRYAEAFQVVRIRLGAV
jgi:LmbE family N-acetylglucosaminyl deacetylase